MSKPNPPKAPGGARKRKPKRFAAVEAGADRDQAVLDMIAGSLREQGRPPTIREIGEAFGIASTNGVRYYLDRLEKAGKIRRDRWTSRGIELSGPVTAARPAAPKAPVIAIPSTTPRNALEIPLLGRVAAGAPILAEENVEDVLIVDGAFVRPGKHFALRVRGDSMKNAGIFDGDVVIVHHDAPLRSGEIAVAIIGEEATVKRYFPRRDKVLLIPENEEYEPIEVRPSDPEFRIAGKVVGVFRRLD
ncbi:MAG TPA: transcriptional repressor LexA [Candidatus Binatia bacterium]|nr:transcriptional repressor LexA [Candidatus Binatia bacterium]